MTLQDLYRTVILDHYRSPRNKGNIENPDLHAVGKNPSCGDELEVFIKLDPAGRVEDVKWNGEGCAICCASSSIMTEFLNKKSKEEIYSLSNKVKNLIKGNFLKDEEKEDLGELVVLEGVSKFPVRVKCATLGWVSIEIAFQGKQEASTE